MLLDLSKMQQVLTTEVNEINMYVENVKDHYMNETFSSAEIKARIENCLQECVEKVELSSRKWQNVKLGTSRLSKNGLDNIESAAKKIILETRSMHDKIASASLSMRTELDTNVNSLMMSINDSLMLDKENKKEIGLKTTTSLDQLK